MSQLLAPYTNAMRLGQGFNSYTQQICLDKAVLHDTPENRKRLQDSRIDIGALPVLSNRQAEDQVKSIESSFDSSDEESPTPDDTDRQRDELIYGSPGEIKDHVEVLPWVKPQIVTYSSRFVDKLSDVTDAMNISGSLSIKTATIGGKASGSYVDSDKFKSSDINFYLQVKVVNQLHHQPEYSIFNMVSNVKKESFAEVYGDTFISGWEEGGELNAIISMKVRNKDKVNEIKASLEAEMTTLAISGEVKGKFEMEKKELSKETETTITVNWSGGGSIKHPSEDWNIASLKKAAAAFPDLVAITPQRTYAILSKYTALATFHAQNKEFSPLQYENAGIYTGSLLDAYMDYKILWKQISQATDELEANRATIVMPTLSEDMYTLAKIKTLPEAEQDARMKQVAAVNQAMIMANTEIRPSTSSSEKQIESGSIESAGAIIRKQTFKSVPPETQVQIFKPSFAGLIAAKKVCRFEMAKIVNEVDLVAKDPSIATDTERDAYFLNPLVFKQLLPVVRTMSAENAKLGINDPSATIILGFDNVKVDADSDVMQLTRLEVDISKHDSKLQNMFHKMQYKASSYRMQGVAGPFDNIHSSVEAFNDLGGLDATFRPTKVSVWCVDGIVTGLEVESASRSVHRHSKTEGLATATLLLDYSGSEIITEVSVTQGPAKDGVIPIVSLKLATSLCQTLETPMSALYENDPANRIFVWTKPDEGTWSVRGFFGFTRNQAISTLGVIWGKDTFVPVPSAAISQPICSSFLSSGPSLRENIKQFKTLSRYQHFSDYFYLSKSVASPPSDGSKSDVDVFNALESIDTSWKIRSIAFASSANKLCGLKVTYRNGTSLIHGNFKDDNQVWTVDTKTDLIIFKFTAGKLSDADANEPGHVETVEFIRNTPEPDVGSNTVPVWPLDVSTLRYLGDNSTRVTSDVNEVAEKAPKIGGYTWSVRGFYGEYSSRGYISKLGCVWGRG